MTCTKQHTKRYTQRNSPPYPANKCRVNSRKRGNDGLLYVAKPNVNGVKRWVKSSKSKTSKTTKSTKSTKFPKLPKRNKYTQKWAESFFSNAANDCKNFVRKANDGHYYKSVRVDGVFQWVKKPKGESKVLN